MIDLSIVIVSFNTKEVLKECLDSIFETVKNLEFEVIMVDNASKDNTVEEISKLKYPEGKLQIIANKENFGFSKANNIGLKKTSGRYVLFLNPDVVVYENTLQGMLKFMDNNPDVGASTCKVVLPSGKLDDSCHRGFPTPWNSFAHFSGLAKLFGKTRLFGGYNLGFMDLTKKHEIDALAGSFMFVRREAGE